MCFRLHSIKIIDSNFYRDIDWPIVIMLAAMIPVGTALQTTGLTDVISSSISVFAGDLSQFWLLFTILIVTMATTDIINNAATAVIMAPISAGIAIELGYPIEAFLMVVAVGASCAFLTPIGHQCNTVVMGPGNYKFTDYWRLGLPLDYINNHCIYSYDPICLDLIPRPPFHKFRYINTILG